MEINSTRLRAATSKNLDSLLLWSNKIPFKIEIKGNPVFKSRKWHLFFVLPELDAPMFNKMPLIIDID